MFSASGNVFDMDVFSLSLFQRCGFLILLSILFVFMFLPISCWHLHQVAWEHCIYCIAFSSGIVLVSWFTGVGAFDCYRLKFKTTKMKMKIIFNNHSSLMLPNPFQ